MPRRCSICHHEGLEGINRALVEGIAFPVLVAKYRVSKDALSRHKAKHLPAMLVKAQEAQAVARADDLLDEVRSLQARALTILDRAERVGDLRTALRAIREARGNLELLAKLVGQIDERPQAQIHLSHEWLELRATIIGALEGHQEAKEAVLKVLEAGMEEGGSRW
jgi:hypothetical protein